MGDFCDAVKNNTVHIPERIAALEAEIEARNRRIGAQEDEIMRLRERVTVLAKDRDKWVSEAEMHSYESAQLATEVERLQVIEQIGRAMVGKNIAWPDVFYVTGQDTNYRLCLALIALDEWRAALEPQP